MSCTRRWQSGLKIEKSLTVYDSTQYVIGIQEMLAKKFSLDKENVRVIGSFVGGGFGGKGNAWAHVSLAVAAAKVVKRPVKIVLSRKGVHLSVGGRTLTEQRVALAANDAGELSALIHTGVTQTTEHNNFAEQFTFPARHLYKAENIWLRQEIVHLDIVPNTFMRAPGESPGTFALESAIDELAHEIGMDPIELRARNEPDTDPVKDIPFSMRNITEAYHAARRYSAGLNAMPRRARRATEDSSSATASPPRTIRLISFRRRRESRFMPTAPRSRKVRCTRWAWAARLRRRRTSPTS